MDIWGTNGKDTLLCGAGNVAVGLGGDDALSSIPGTGALDQILFGGIGNDTYLATSNAGTVVQDVGGVSDLLVADIFLYNPTSIYTVANKHLWMGDYATNCFVFIPDVRNCGIDAIAFASGEMYPFGQFYEQVKPNIVDYPAYMNELIGYIYNYGNQVAAAKNLPQNIGQDVAPSPTPPPAPAPEPTPPEPTMPPQVVAAKEKYFDENAYINNKLASLTADGAQYTLTSVAEAFASAGFTPWEHFSRFGWAEKSADGSVGINPGSGFDVTDYLAQKYAQLQAAGIDITPTGVVEAFQAAGIDPVTHYALYGQAEGIVPQAEYMPTA